MKAKQNGIDIIAFMEHFAAKIQAQLNASPDGDFSRSIAVSVSPDEKEKALIVAPSLQGNKIIHHASLFIAFLTKVISVDKKLFINRSSAQQIVQSVCDNN